MGKIKANNQYARVAKEAYRKILDCKLKYRDAWDAAVDEIITRESKEKACPRNAFLGLCESGDLKDILGTAKSNNTNYTYSKFAIGEFNKDLWLSNRELWKRVYKKFEEAKSHNGQLDVVRGLWDYIK